MPCPGYFLCQNDRIEKVQAWPAVFLGYFRTQKALLPHLAPDALGHNARRLPLVHVGCDFLFKELPHGLPECPVFFSIFQNFHVLFSPPWRITCHIICKHVFLHLSRLQKEIKRLCIPVKTLYMALCHITQAPINLDGIISNPVCRP